ncbi:MAG TPA: NADH-quinone oxidoreductase subunit K [Anaerolineaceae bacterium]|jgi:NADH:ubiquinone oxidoreductase subunit K|nr:NADH-quinone oxidoreductase subunit K [Anaerolineaceae bacterium]
MTFSIAHIVTVGVIVLVAAGFYGLLIARNLIKVVVALQVLTKGVLLALVMAGRASGQMGVGQSMAFTVIVADTIVAVVGLAFAVQVRECFGSLDLNLLSRLRR